CYWLPCLANTMINETLASEVCYNSFMRQGFGFEILGKKPAQEISLNLSVKNAGFGKKIDRKNKGNENSDCRR
ncbi:hypothetical protein M2T75_38825, partial [Klebsiella pneumoniae]|nr:hypothetical protein [Klebsiella pneumoniae]